MRIWADAPKNIAYIENVCEAFTGSLIASNNGDLISIYHTGLSIFEVRDMDYRNIQDQHYNSFSSAQSLLNYLRTIFVVQQNAALTFYFSSPLQEWVINHNLGYYPSTKIYSLGGQEIEASVLNTSTNQVLVDFETPSSGFARLF